MKAQEPMKINVLALQTNKKKICIGLGVIHVNRSSLLLPICSVCCICSCVTLFISISVYDEWTMPGNSPVQNLDACVILNNLRKPQPEKWLDRALKPAPPRDICLRFMWNLFRCICWINNKRYFHASVLSFIMKTRLIYTWHWEILAEDLFAIS